LIEGITKTGIPVEYVRLGSIKILDEDDRVFYDTAEKSSAYLITGNLKHFPPRPFIVIPVVFFGYIPGNNIF